MKKQTDSRTAGAPPGSLHSVVRRLVRLWRREAHHNLGAEWAYKNQKPISLNRAAFEKGLALAKQQCADQLTEAMKVKPPNDGTEPQPGNGRGLKRKESNEP